MVTNQFFKWNDPPDFPQPLNIQPRHTRPSKWPRFRSCSIPGQNLTWRDPIPLTAKTLSAWAYRPPPPPHHHHHHHPVEYTPWICFIQPLQPPSSCSPKYNGSNQAVAPPEVLAHVAIRLWRWFPCLINRCFLISFQHPKHLLIVPHLIQSILGAGTKPWEHFLCLDAVAIPTDQGNWGSGILVLNLQRSSKKNQPSPSSSTLPQTS